ncbi:MAG: sulfite exporter TauE/SafE family protein [Proteobacteria bacterium]|nr:sulfite exporter TauE/SafE family protein [Pseudomonadota bacterium]
MIFIAYFIIGIITGVMSGLLGLGGGVIMVPALTFLFSWQAFPEQHIMHLATGTSLAAMIMTTMITVWSHNKRGVVQWSLLQYFLPGAMLGSLLGVYFARFISTNHLKIIFALFIIILGLRLIWGANRKNKIAKNFPPKIFLFLLATLIGMLSGMIGLGGGLLFIPLFLWLGNSMVQASATSAACAFPTALTGALMAAIVGWHIEGLPAKTWGFIYWPGALTFGLASLISSPFGVSMAHHLPVPTLKRIFGGVLLVIAIRLLW